MFNINKLFVIRTVITVLILILAVIVYCSLTSKKAVPVSSKSSHERVWTLAGIPLKSKDVRLKISSYGTVKSINSIDISSLVNGTVIYALPGLRAGKIVKKSEILLKIDDSDYKNKYLQSLAKIEQIKALIDEKTISIKNSKEVASSNFKQYKLEEINCKRFSKLADLHVASQETLENAKASMEKSKTILLDSIAEYKTDEANLLNLKAQLKSAKIARNILKLDIQRCIIKSPIDGRISNVPVERDEYVAEGAELFTVVDDNNVEIPVSISMDDASNVFNFKQNRKNYKHWFNFATNVPVMIYWSDDINKSEQKGRIIGIEQYNKDTRTITLLVAPLSGHNKNKAFIPLVSGMFCKVQFEGKTLHNAIRVPFNAIQLNHMIYSVGKNNRLLHHNAQVLSYGRATAVVSVRNMKNANYLIVQKLPQGITDGARVKIINPLTQASELSV
ncbi:MAG TPA: HlyD family efflux transporter periplasmic adaptor subunit [Victivallales bacterium]|nr:HlyD family efflux transporter periplasmic adaptor subunit [Victivallales bacterium]